jgi:hypothetical protein
MAEFNSCSKENFRRKKTIDTSSHTNKIKRCFANLQEEISQDEARQLFISIDNIYEAIEKLRVDLANDIKAFDKLGKFKGWNDPYIASRLCQVLGITNRFYLSKNSIRKFSHDTASFIFGEGPYEEKDKAYIPPNIANLVSFHNAIQRLGIAFALTTGISFGELLSKELIKLFHLNGIESAKIASAIAVNLLVFGGSTKVTEKFISETKNKPNYNQFKRLVLLGVVIASCKIPMVIFTGIAGSANTLGEQDRNNYAQIEAQYEFEIASSKTNQAIKDLEEGGKLYFQLKLLNSKENKSTEETIEIQKIKSKIDNSGYNNIVNLYGEQLYIEYLKNQALSNRGKNDGSIAGINKEAQSLDYLGLKYISGRGFLDTGKGKFEKEKAKIKQDMKKFNAELIEGSRPKLDFIRDAEIMKVDFAKLTPWQWLEKWLPRLTNDQDAKNTIARLKTIKLQDLPSSDQLNLVRLKLHNELYYGDKVPSFVAYVFIALLFEGLSSLTLGLLYMHKDFSQKYANLEFQSGYKNLTDLVKSELMTKFKNSDSTDSSLPALPSNCGVFNTIIEQLMRENPIAGTNSIIDIYITENYSKRYKQLKRKKEIEEQREKGVDIRNPIIIAITNIANSLNKKNKR